MTSTPTLQGILPALVTPLNAAEEFLPAAFEALLERVYTAGVHGVYVCGQTGEGLLLPVETRERVAEVAVRVTPAGRSVVVHVGAARTSDAVRLARHAARVGAHAVSSLPPAGPYSFAELRTYYERLASASELPVLVYYFPEIAPAIQTEEQILELCSIPNVVGLKFTDFNLYRLGNLRQAGATLFNGRDEVLAAGLLMGADGGIGSFYNLVPELFVALYGHANRGEWAEARRVQDRINELITLTLRFPVFPAIKTMLGWSGVECGPCVAPRRALSAAEKEELAGLLAASSFAGNAFAAAVA